MLQVHLQTQQEGKLSVVRLTGTIVREQGVLALYNGLSASLCRQLSYSTTRFGIYEESICGGNIDRLGMWSQVYGLPASFTI
ncbi:hypothetical protein J6590_046613 [Homalodisca vitripennis]|nr:hypothetical protein J6590_046613 [Homalodisca vitripennis]